tara:strand:- start:746 stop:970 length:225 start_codon:yes stop_codon:yes gene_type:complete
MDLQQNLNLGILMEKQFIRVDYTKQNQKQEQQQNNSGEIVCCGNHVFRVINGQRHWISTPPDDWETMDGRVWTE